MATDFVPIIASPTLNARPQLGKWLGEAAVFMLFFAALVLPQVPATADLNIRAELIVLALFMVIYFWLLMAGLVHPLHLNGMFVAALVFCMTVAISIIYGADVLHHEVLYRDYFELPKAWLPAIYFTVTYESDISEDALQRFFKFMVFPILLVCSYAWTQHLDLNIAYSLNPYFTGGEHVDLALKRYDRVYSTFGNPNVLGQFLTLMILSYTAAFLFKMGSRVRNLGIGIICLITMVFTGSRYALLSTALGFLLLMMFVMSARRKGAKIIGLLLLGAIFSYTFITVQRGAVHQSKRFEELRHPSDVNSLRLRLDGLWREAGDFILSSPFVGHGPAKHIFTGVFTDSEYLDILKEFGFVGFIPYMAFYLWPLYYLWKSWRISQRLGPGYELQYPATVLTVRTGIVIVIVALFMNIGMFTYLNWLLMGVLWMLIGLSVRSAMKIIAHWESLPLRMVAAR